VRTYCVPTDKFVKIWFTKNPNEFLSLKNKTRLVEFCKNNPDATLTIIYSSALLNNHGRADFEKLKQRHPNIIFSDFSSPEFKEKITEKCELQLYRIAENELTRLYRGGNVAAASDAVRLLSPSYKSGIYSDFDTVIKSRKGITPIPEPLLFNSPEEEMYCNDVIIVANDATENEPLKNLQNEIVHRYSAAPKKYLLEYVNDKMIDVIFEKNLQLYLFGELKKPINELKIILKRFFEAGNQPEFLETHLGIQLPEKFRIKFSNIPVLELREKIDFFINLINHHLAFSGNPKNGDQFRELFMDFTGINIRLICDTSGPEVYRDMDPNRKFSYQKTLCCDVIEAAGKLWQDGSWYISSDVLQNPIYGAAARTLYNFFRAHKDKKEKLDHPAKQVKSDDEHFHRKK